MMPGILNHKLANGWPLFWGVAAVVSMLTVLEMLALDMTNPPDISHMIGYSVRLSVPFIFLVVAISALPVLWPGRVSAWLMRNRRYIGLCFAVAMAWQGFFIALMSVFQSDYYYKEIFYLRDELEGSSGYLFLAAMVLTSFQFGRRWLTQRQWKLLHRSGMVFLWAYPFSVYWWNLSYYPDPQPIDYVFYVAGFTAFALRIVAWRSKRKTAASTVGADALSAGNRLIGMALIVFALLAAATGLQWQDPLTEFLLLPAWSANLVLWLPFWPFEPFLPLAILALGTLFLTRYEQPQLAAQSDA